MIGYLKYDQMNIGKKWLPGMRKLKKE